MSATKLLDGLLRDIEDTWDLTSEEIGDIRDKMLEFAVKVSDSPQMQKEVKSIAADF